MNESTKETKLTYTNYTLVQTSKVTNVVRREYTMNVVKDR